MPPTPSWLWGTWSVIFGMNPPTSVPVVSVMYLPTVPLEFARPSGNRDDFELSSRRAVSRALAARTTTLARTRRSVPVALSTYARPGHGQAHAPDERDGARGAGGRERPRDRRGVRRQGDGDRPARARS